MSPSPVPDGYVRGAVFYDGGADKSTHNDYARQAFWNLAGGYGARIVVLTTNADVSEADYGYAAAFQAMEAAKVQLLVLSDRSSGNDPAILRAIEHSTAVFLSGGHPLKWSTRIGGTPLATAIRRANATGKTVGGVGGSAAFLGNHMLVYREDTHFPVMAPGLGLSNRILVAAHFDTAKHGELLRMAIASNPYLLGIGLPDKSAIIRRADVLLEVVGMSGVQIVDGSRMASTNMALWQPGMPFEAKGLVMLDLPRDYRYDPEAHRALPPEISLPMPTRSSF
ncbi:MAG: Type 1 glutamine amidotransferase-like domain-containing protein [Anaerolineae bacterium]